MSGGWVDSVADASDVAVCAIRSPERRAAAYAPVQIIPASNLVSPLDGDMSDRLRFLALQRKLQRVSAYREWQGLSHALVLITSRSLDDFRLPADLLLEPVAGDLKRMVNDTNPDINVAYILDEATNVRRPVLPPTLDVRKLCQLTVAIDSGSVGRAAASFAKHKLRYNVFVVYDKIHRLVRDVKLAAEKASQTTFTRRCIGILDPGTVRESAAVAQTHPLVLEFFFPFLPIPQQWLRGESGSMGGIRWHTVSGTLARLLRLLIEPATLWVGGVVLEEAGSSQCARRVLKRCTVDCAHFWRMSELVGGQVRATFA